LVPSRAPISWVDPLAQKHYLEEIIMRTFLVTAIAGTAFALAVGGLTGAATAAHFHGPAKIGVAAAPVVPIKGDLR
jgi:hypothetical protein